jgi:hypothetical protein
VYVGLGKPDGTFATLKLFGTGDEIDRMAVADFDEDGRVDFAASSGFTHTQLFFSRAAGTWVVLGHGLAGKAGIPQLAGTGLLIPGSNVEVSLTGAVSFAPLWLVVGFSALQAPFKGGIMVPSVDLVIGLATNGAGSLSLGGSWPPGFPAETSLWLQAWIADDAGPAGFAASDALQATTP